MTMKMTASPKASGVGSRSREGISLMSQHLIFQGVGNRQKGGLRKCIAEPESGTGLQPVRSEF